MNILSNDLSYTFNIILRLRKFDMDSVASGTPGPFQNRIKNTFIYLYTIYDFYVCKIDLMDFHINFDHLQSRFSLTS